MKHVIPDGSGDSDESAGDSSDDCALEQQGDLEEASGDGSEEFSDSDSHSEGGSEDDESISREV